MKIRTGFVSNSSSSSFCIYGVYVKEKDILTGKEILEKGYVQKENIKYDDALDDIQAGPNKMGLSVELTPYSRDEDCLYVGVSWLNVKDDETGAQFKARVEELVKKVIRKPDKLKFESFEEAYDDNF